MPVQCITSFRNPHVKYLRSLRMRKYRERESRFLIEGIRIVEEALDRGAPLETLVYAPDLLVSDRAQALVEQVAPDRRVALAADVFGSLSDRDRPQGIAAVVQIEDPPLVSLPLDETMLTLVAYQLRDPGNLGAIIRTADAAGVTGLVVVEPAVDLYDPQAVRATMGSLFALPIVRVADESALLAWYAEARQVEPELVVIGTSAHARELYYDVNYCRPVVLLLGSERHGLPETMRRPADHLVRLPMAGRATSLNVSAAAAALIYEVVRQRATGDGCRGKLP
jgi:TrmH family RNA methyltransferase